MITPILNLKVSWPLYDSILSSSSPKKSTTRLKILWLQKSEPHCGIRSTHLASHKVGDLNSVPPVKYRRCHFRNFYSDNWQEELISALLLWCRKGESVLQSKASYVGDHFFLFPWPWCLFWFSSYFARRSQIVVTPSGLEGYRACVNHNSPDLLVLLSWLNLCLSGSSSTHLR